MPSEGNGTNSAWNWVSCPRPRIHESKTNIAVLWKPSSPTFKTRPGCWSLLWPWHPLGMNASSRTTSTRRGTAGATRCARCFPTGRSLSRGRTAKTRKEICLVRRGPSRGPSPFCARLVGWGSGARKTPSATLWLRCLAKAEQAMRGLNRRCYMFFFDPYEASLAKIKDSQHYMVKGTIEGGCSPHDNLQRHSSCQTLILASMISPSVTNCATTTRPFGYHDARVVAGVFCAVGVPLHLTLRLLLIN